MPPRRPPDEGQLSFDALWAAPDAKPERVTARRGDSPESPGGSDERVRQAGARALAADQTAGAVYDPGSRGLLFDVGRDGRVAGGLAGGSTGRGRTLRGRGIWRRSAGCGWRSTGPRRWCWPSWRTRRPRRSTRTTRTWTTSRGRSAGGSGTSAQSRSSRSTSNRQRTQRTRPGGSEPASRSRWANVSAGSGRAAHPVW